MIPEYENLIDYLIKESYLRRPEIIEGFKAIDRADFVSEECKDETYENVPLSIGFNQTISQPLTVAFMIELLEPKVGEKILEVGAGSGWQTAILSYIVSQGGNSELGKVIALEIIPELRQLAENNVAKYNFIEKGIAQIFKADGSKGYRKDAPYDKIITGAASKSDVSQEWRKQLKINGRIVAPVDQSIWVIDKIAKDSYRQKEYFGFSFVPLVKN